MVFFLIHKQRQESQNKTFSSIGALQTSIFIRSVFRQMYILIFLFRSTTNFIPFISLQSCTTLFHIFSSRFFRLTSL
jgi:hypothetical protein